MKIHNYDWPRAACVIAAAYRSEGLPTAFRHVVSDLRMRFTEHGHEQLPDTASLERCATLLVDALGNNHDLSEDEVQEWFRD